MIEADEKGQMVGIRLNKATSITVSVSLLIVLLGGAGAGGAYLYNKGESDGQNKARLNALEELAEQNSATLRKVLESTRRIEENMGDRWTRTHMRRLVREWGELNPALKLPDVDRIAEGD